MTGDPYWVDSVENLIQLVLWYVAGGHYSRGRHMQDALYLLDSLVWCGDMDNEDFGLIELIKDDMLRFRYRGDVIFMAMPKEIYEAKLGDKKIAALLLPWNAPQFDEPRQVTEVKSDCIQKNISPLENGVVRMWLKLSSF